MVSKRYVHQWQQLGGPECDGKTRHWTEVSLTLPDLMELIGCDPGSHLISLLIDRSGFNLTLTVDEHQEKPCLEQPYERSSGASPGPLPGSSSPSSPSA